MRKKCLGCGVTLQAVDQIQPGYVPIAILEQEEQIVCQRCYRLKNYAQLEKTSFSKEAYLSAVKEGIAEGEVIVYVVDVIDFAGSWQPEIIALIGAKPWILAVNKIDLLPDKTSPEQLRKWLKQEITRQGLDLPQKIAFLSSKKGVGLDQLKANYYRLLGKKRVVTIVGTTNAGKSSLLNALLATKDKPLTVSKFPGTTLGINPVTVPEEKLKILDTPGLIPAGRISDLLCAHCNLALIPAQEISRKTYKLDEGQVLLFGGLLSFTVVEGECRPILVAFAAQGVKFHRTRWERRDEILSQHSGDWLTPPCGDCQAEFSAQAKKTVQVTLAEGEDLAVAGLGWLSVRRGPVVLEVTVPETVQLLQRPALINPNEEGGHSYGRNRRKN